MKLVIEIPEKVHGLLKHFESSVEDVSSSADSDIKEIIIDAVEDALAVSYTDLADKNHRSRYGG